MNATVENYLPFYQSKRNSYQKASVFVVIWWLLFGWHDGCVIDGVLIVFASFDRIRCPWLGSKIKRNFKNSKLVTIPESWISIYLRFTFNTLRMKKRWEEWNCNHQFDDSLNIYYHRLMFFYIENHIKMKQSLWEVNSSIWSWTHKFRRRLPLLFFFLRNESFLLYCNLLLFLCQLCFSQ